MKQNYFKIMMLRIFINEIDIYAIVTNWILFMLLNLFICSNDNQHIYSCILYFAKNSQNFNLIEGEIIIL